MPGPATNPLSSLGADARVLLQLAELPDPGARVARIDRGRAVVVDADGPRTAVPSRHLPDALCVGDWVAVRRLPDDNDVITSVLPRTSLLSRAQASGRSEAQPLVANVDLVVVAVSAAVKPSPRRLERLLALAWESGARPVVVLTMADRVDVLDPVVEAYEPSCVGLDLHVVSAVSGLGVDAVRAALGPGVSAALVGASGVGKSTLVNALVGAEVLRTGDRREVDGKGRHTTTARELVLIPGGGVLIDTPGLRSVGMVDLEEGLDRAFADIGDLAADCRFSDCRHEGEPGCAVAAAVDAGLLSEARVHSHHKLQREMEWMAAKQDARLRAERSKQWRSIAKSQRARGHR